MSGYVSLDVPVETTAICVTDCVDRIVRELPVAHDPDALATSVEPFGSDIRAIRLEADPMPPLLAAGYERQVLSAILTEMRPVNAAPSAVAVKTDREDAPGIAELLRMGWFQPVHRKPPSARDIRLTLSARETLGRRIKELDNSIRGLLQGVGLQVSEGTRGRFSGLVRALVAGNPVFSGSISPLLRARAEMAVEFARPVRQVRKLPQGMMSGAD